MLAFGVSLRSAQSSALITNVLAAPLHISTPKTRVTLLHLLIHTKLQTNNHLPLDQILQIVLQRTFLYL